MPPSNAPQEPDPPGPGHREPGLGGLIQPLVLTALAACLVALSALLPGDLAGTGTAAAFLGLSWWGAVRGQAYGPQRHGLSLGGLLDPEPLSAKRMLKDTAGALLWALAVSCVVFPLYWLGWVWFWEPRGPFSLSLPEGFLDVLAGQLLVIALPEEAFFRGYLQSAFDRRWPPKLRFLGARLGAGVVLAAALFALIHLVTTPHPARLAVFFPGLLFGWLKTRTGGIGASVFLHAFSNVFASFLASSYGLLP